MLYIYLTRSDGGALAVGTAGIIAVITNSY